MFAQATVYRLHERIMAYLMLVAGSWLVQSLRSCLLHSISLISAIHLTGSSHTYKHNNSNINGMPITRTTHKNIISCVD